MNYAVRALAGLSLYASALGATPALAQDDGADTGPDTDQQMQDEFDAVGALFGDMFGRAEPLTPEQEARIPAAQAVVLKLFPEGTYARMMDETMAPMMDAMLGNITGAPALQLMELTGLPPSVLAGVDEARLAAAVALLDPNAGARNAEIADMTMTFISQVVVKI